MHIQVVPYQPTWPQQFRAIEATLKSILSDVSIIAIEHVGSTSVPDLPAKPILDIDVVVSRENVAAATAALQRAGYDYKGEWGIPDRHAFRCSAFVPARNLYVCVEGCLAVRNHLAVRDVLRRDGALRDEYGVLKRELAKREWGDDNGAGCGDGKSHVLGKVLEKAGVTVLERGEILSVSWKTSMPLKVPNPRRPSPENRGYRIPELDLTSFYSKQFHRTYDIITLYIIR